MPLAFAPIVKPDHQIQPLVHSVGIQAQLSERPVAIPCHNAESVRLWVFIPGQAVGRQERKVVIKPAAICFPCELAFNASLGDQGVPQERLCWFQRPAVIGQQQWEALKRSAFNHEISRGQDKPHRPMSFRSFAAALKLRP